MTETMPELTETEDQKVPVFTFSSEARMNELVAKANKAVVKLGLPLITVTSVTPRKVKIDTECGTNTIIVFDAILDIPTQLVKIEGQEVVARLVSVDGLNMITRISKTEEIDLDAYRETAITCQHCDLVRSRKASWVVKDNTRGLIQVGDSCATLYFGIGVDRILRASTSIFGILNSEEEGGFRRASQFNFETFTSVVCWRTMTAGFVTQKSAGDYGTSTSSDARFLAHPCLSTDKKVQAEFAQMSSDHRAWRAENFEGEILGEKVLDWWMAREDLSEFEHNCKVAILSQDPRFSGLIAYGIKIWIDAHFTAPKAEKLASGLPSAWVGVQKQRLTFETVKVIRLAGYETDYGYTTVVTFETPEGNLLVWKATCNPGVTLGKSYKLKGTVKTHDEYKGQNQTQLSRCVIEDLP